MIVTARWKLALLLFSGCGYAQSCYAQSQGPLGSVEESKEACPAGPIAGTVCKQLQVMCPSLRPLPTQVRITEPAAGVKFRGTVVMGSGGNGAGFYAGQEGGRILVGEIAAMGFRVVDKSYDGGTNTFEGGLKKQSCHYAALLTWIHDHIHKQGKFVATGNSGGSADIGYALTTWSRGDILDVAILTSGPPLSRLDYACVKEASPDWAKQCASIVPKGVMECMPACILGPPRSPVDSFVYKTGVCRQVSPDETPQQLLDDSVVHPGAVLDYPKTRAYFLYGTLDCGEPVPIGLTYATKVTSYKSIQFVPRTPHALFSTPEGRQAIKRAIEEGTAGGTHD